MKHSFSLSLLLASACAAGAAHAATTASGSASATVVSESLSMSNSQQLYFGNINSAGGGGTVTVSVDGQRSATGIGGFKVDEGFSRASFDVNGTPGRYYTINLPVSQNFTVSPPPFGGATLSQLQVTNFTAYSVNRAASGNLGLLNGSGIDRVYVGGKLNVPSNASTGTYRGLVNVTISY